LKIEDLDLLQQWTKVLDNFEHIFGKRPADLNAILYIIGVQELGKGPRLFTKEEKQDLMHIAICKLLSFEGYYELEGHDNEGWPHWKLVKKLPPFDLFEQEKLLKIQVIEYCKAEGIGIWE
jgi:hypothetical protein